MNSSEKSRRAKELEATSSMVRSTSKGLRSLFAAALLFSLGLVDTSHADENTWSYNGIFNTTHQVAGLGERDAFTAVGRLSSGKRIAAGYTRNEPFILFGSGNNNDNFALARFGIDGQLDTAFTPACLPAFGNCSTPGTRFYGIQFSVFLNVYNYSDDRASDVVVRSGEFDSVGDDAIFVVGTSVLNGLSSGAILKLDEDGNYDTAFDGDGRALLTLTGLETTIDAAGLQSDGKLVVAGSFWAAGGTKSIFVARYLDTGALDNTFGINGIRTIGLAPGGTSYNTHVYDMTVGHGTVAHDNYIVVVGDSVAPTETRGHVALARFTPNGAVDISFGGTGIFIEEFGPTQSGAFGVVMETDGDVVIAGGMYPSGTQAGLLARFSAAGVLDLSDSVEPGADFGQSYAGTTFQDLVWLPAVSYFAVVGQSKGGSTGNDPIYYIADSALQPVAPAVVGPIFPGAGYAASIERLGTSSYTAIVGLAGGEAAIRQPRFSSCGNGNVESGEDCDGGACCDECSFVTAGTVCNPSAGVCDVAEVCSGADATCPADAVAPAGTLCNPSAGTCDVAETCDGVGTTCPADVFAAPGTVCNPSAGSCDLAEECTGASPNCPADEFLAAGTVCNAAAGICDSAEECTGAGPACPADTFVAAGTICNAAVPGAPCDVAEECTGADADCPVDGYLPAGTVCRAGVDLCDAEETCTGAGIFCPADQPEPAGTLCRGAVDACDVEETCDGVAASCPADAFVAAGTPAPVLCDDGQACSADVCDGAGGCDNSGAAISAGIDFNEDGLIDAADDVDTDGDGIIDACDICTSDCNPDQLDTDGDCSAAAPWNESGKPECGDVCDVCPSSDEVTLALDPNCAVFDYNAPDGCCEEVGAGVSVGPAGESCGGPAGDTEFTATGSTSSAAMRIPPGTVADDTSFAADSVDKGEKEFFVRGGGGRYVAGWDFSPEGITFGQPVTICMSWNDLDNDGFLETSEGYDFKVTEANIAPYHVDAINGEYKLADKCSLVPCGSFDGSGFPDDWGLHANTGLPNSRYDEVSTPLVDESTLGACCGATENKYCFEVLHFSTYAFGDPNCLAENLDRTKLKVVKIHKEVGEQKIVFSAEFNVPVDESTNLPDPAIAPVANGFQISLIDLEAGEPTLWSAKIEGGAYDKSSKSGWKVNSKGTSFVYKGRDRADGVKKVVIRKLYNKSPGLVKVKVVANRAAVAIDASVVQAEISLDPAGFLDRCARTDFEVPSPSANGFCATNGSETALICR